MKSKSKNIIGLKSGKVKLLSYNPEWVKIFRKEEKILRNVIGDIEVNIQHVGSTAIPGIPAKPIIDIIIGVSSPKDVEKCIKPLEKAGYKYKGEERPGEYLFTKDPIYCLHMTKFNNKTWNSYISFRNQLRANKKLANEYKNLKLKLAKKFPDDRESYHAGKVKFIEEVVKKAKELFP